MAKVLLPLADGFEDIEALSVVDVLRRGEVEVVTAAVGETLAVTSARGVAMTADRLLKDVIDDEYDVIVLPGGGGGTENLKSCGALIERLRRQRSEGRLLAAICAAPTVLQVAGIFEESHFATCYPTCQMELHCNWVNEPVVEHEGLITGQGPGTSILFALVILKALAGESVAKHVARGMVFDF